MAGLDALKGSNQRKGKSKPGFTMLVGVFVQDTLLFGLKQNQGKLRPFWGVPRMVHPQKGRLAPELGSVSIPEGSDCFLENEI